MTATKPASIENIANAFVNMLRGDSTARRLYGRMHHEVVELWLLTEPIDVDHELRIYRLAAVLDRTFPNSLIEFHLVNPAHFEPFRHDQIIPVDDPNVTLFHES